MKTRSGFVSNSSSSSFILAQTDKLKNVTKEVWVEMLRNLYKDYDKELERHRWSIVNEDIEDWYFPFCVFDLKTEKEEATKELDHLKSWMATSATIKNGKLEKAKNVYRKWRKTIDKVEESVLKETEERFPGCYVSVDISADEVNSNLKNQTPIFVMRYGMVNKKKKPNFNLPLSERWINALQYLKRELGICTMFDVMVNKKAALAIHFDENEYMRLEGIWDEDTKKWKTEYATWERLCEVIAKYLVAHNLVDANFTWKDLSNATLAVNMHEG